MTTLSPSVVTKISKLVPRLASNHDGEVVATARAITRTLRSAGNDLHDVVAMLSTPGSEQIVYRDRPKPAKPKKQRQRPPVDWSDEDCLEEVLRDGERLLAEARLDGGQRGFVISALDRAGELGQSFRMSVKQLAWFRRIVVEKLGGCDGR